MEKQDFEFIQEQIGYFFKNPDLLQQAFIRRSYSKENGGADNEVLEFIGDKVLDITVIRYLTDKFGYMADRNDEYQEFFCEYSEGKLTRLKAQMVEKKTLAKRIDELELAQFLIMGRGDIRNNVAEEISVKEDLFEAILGAVAKDSNWDFEKLQSVMEIMLDPDSFLDSDEENYVQLIQEWGIKENGTFPRFKYTGDSGYKSCFVNFNNNVPRRTVHTASVVLDWNAANANKYKCELIFREDFDSFADFGRTKNEARKNVCRYAYEWLEQNNLLFTIRDEIDNPNKDDAINQLEILARRGYFSVPTYEFMEEYDGDGNPVWIAECHIDGEDYFCDAVSSSKKEAKKQAAFKMLKHVLERKE